MSRILKEFAACVGLLIIRTSSGVTLSGSTAAHKGGYSSSAGPIQMPFAPETLAINVSYKLWGNLAAPSAIILKRWANILKPTLTQEFF